MPPKLYLPLPKYAGDFRAMPAYLAGSAGVKWVNMHPENPARHGLPSVMGVYILSDPATAVPLAVMDGTSLTAFRTGAAGAVAGAEGRENCSRTERPPGVDDVTCTVSAIVVNMNITAHHVVARDRNVAAARGPNAVWLPDPPKAPAKSAASPPCSRMTASRTRQIKTCSVTRTKKYFQPIASRIAPAKNDIAHLTSLGMLCSKSGGSLSS